MQRAHALAIKHGVSLKNIPFDGMTNGAFLAYYGVLSSTAERSAELAAELKTVVDFMTTGPRKKAPAPPT